MSHFADEETLALIAKLQATVQEQAGEIERLLDHNKRLEESASEIIDRQQHKVKGLMDALEKCSVQLTRLGYSANHADAALAAVKGE